MDTKTSSLQRLNSNVKRAVLIPQKTNLRFELNYVESTSDASDSANLRKSSLQRLPRVSSHRSDAPLRGSSNNLIDPLKVSGDVIERFLDSVPAIGLAREDSKIMRSRVIEEMYRIQERATITPEERQKLVQLAMSMDAPRLARRLVSEAREHHEDCEAAGAFLTGQQLSVRGLDGGPAPLPTSSSTSSSSSSSTTTSPTSPTPRPLASPGRGARDDDAVFCKAFDEVERIRQRILQRANAPLASQTAPKTQSTPPLPPDGAAPWPAPALRREASASSVPSRRSSVDLQPLHDFTARDLLDDDDEEEDGGGAGGHTTLLIPRTSEEVRVSGPGPGLGSLEALVEHVGVSPRGGTGPPPPRETLPAQSLPVSSAAWGRSGPAAAALPPLGLELQRARALLLSPLADWIRLSKHLPDTSSNTSSNTPQGGALLSPRRLVPAGPRLSPKPRPASTSAATASTFAFEATAAAAATSSVVAVPEPSPFLSQPRRGPAHPLADDLLVSKAKKSLQALGDHIAPQPQPLALRLPGTPHTPRSRVSPRNSNGSSAQGTPRGASSHWMVSQSVSSVKLAAALPLRPATAAPGVGVPHSTLSTSSTSSLSPCTASTSPPSAMKAAGELAVQGPGTLAPLSRNNSVMSASESLANTSQPVAVACTPAGRSSKMAFAAALNAGDAVGKLMAEMFSQRK